MAAHRIYLAGPEVFLPEAEALGQRKAALCAEAGFEGVFPLDQALDLSGLPKHEKARRIAITNEALMRSCDLLIANLSPFRGVSMDSGTAFEVGFMRALDRPVLGYTNCPRDYRARADAHRARGIGADDSDRIDAAVEDFDLAENLMIEVAILEAGGFVVRHAATEGHTMADLAGFSACLAQARTIMASRN